MDFKTVIRNTWHFLNVSLCKNAWYFFINFERSSYQGSLYTANYIEFIISYLGKKPDSDLLYLTSHSKAVSLLKSILKNSV